MAWYNLLSIPRNTQAWNTVLEYHYIPCLLSLRFFRLLADVTDVSTLPRLSGSVELTVR